MGLAALGPVATIPVILAVPGGYDSSDPGGARSDLDRSLILVALVTGGFLHPRGEVPLSSQGDGAHVGSMAPCLQYVSSSLVLGEFLGGR